MGSRPRARPESPEPKRASQHWGRPILAGMGSDVPWDSPVPDVSTGKLVPAHATLGGFRQRFGDALVTSQVGSASRTIVPRHIGCAGPHGGRYELPLVRRADPTSPAGGGWATRGRLGHRGAAGPQRGGWATAGLDGGSGAEKEAVAGWNHASASRVSLNSRNGGVQWSPMVRPLVSCRVG